MSIVSPAFDLRCATDAYALNAAEDKTDARRKLERVIAA
jgi:hypothetical protein